MMRKYLLFVLVLLTFNFIVLAEENDTMEFTETDMVEYSESTEGHGAIYGNSNNDVSDNDYDGVIYGVEVPDTTVDADEVESNTAEEVLTTGVEEVKKDNNKDILIASIILCAIVSIVIITIVLEYRKKFIKKK